MKKSLNKLVLAVSISVLSLTLFNSCKKYPDGPTFTLLTKKERVCNTWKMDKYFINSADQTSFFNTVAPGYQCEIKKDGTYLSSTNFGVLEEGKWDFTNNKEHITTTINSTGKVTDSQILKLKDKELWLKQTDSNNNIIELHLIEK